MAEQDAPDAPVERENQSPGELVPFEGLPEKHDIQDDVFYRLDEIELGQVVVLGGAEPSLYSQRHANSENRYRYVGEFLHPKSVNGCNQGVHLISHDSSFRRFYSYAGFRLPVFRHFNHH